MKIAPPVHVLRLWMAAKLRAGMSPQDVAAELRKRLQPVTRDATDLARERYAEAAALIEQIERGEL
jgi:hypothetical protein